MLNAVLWIEDDVLHMHGSLCIAPVHHLPICLICLYVSNQSPLLAVSM